MLEATVRTRVREHIEAELNPRERTLGITLLGQQSKLNARGLLGGSAGYIAYANAGRDELAVRAQIIWAAIRRAHVALVRTVDGNTLADLRQQIAEFMTEHTARVSRQVLARMTNLDRGGQGRAHIEQEIGARSRELVAQFDVEAQYYVNELEREAARAAQSGAATYNFNAPIGSVQTGAYSTSHVSMAGADREGLRDALEAFARAVTDNNEIENERREQALEVVTDTIAAVRSEKPNAHKIAALLGGVSNVVRTVASLKPAYETLRDIAMRIGLVLQ